MVFKILGKRNGKKTVSDNTGNDVIKVTKMLEFLTEVEPRSAIIGSIVRFMWNPGTGTSLCQVQGKICKRIDSFKKSRKEIWDSNRVVIQNLVIIDRWGEEHIEKLPKSMVVDLHRNQIWALGTEVTLEKIGENEALEIDMNKTPSVIECFDYDITDIQKEKGATDPSETIEDDTGNTSDKGSDSVMASDNME